MNQLKDKYDSEVFELKTQVDELSKQLDLEKNLNNRAEVEV